VPSSYEEFVRVVVGGVSSQATVETRTDLTANSQPLQLLLSTDDIPIDAAEVKAANLNLEKCVKCRRSAETAKKFLTIRDIPIQVNLLNLQIPI